jgi:hypothetical protein
MAQNPTPADLIVGRIACHPGCSLDELATFCPELTWNQVFLEVDRLSRAGRVLVRLTERGCYRLTLAHEKHPDAQPSDRPERPPVPAQSHHDSRCKRCGGLMVSEHNDDFRGWRCIGCGDRVDPMILAKRRKAGSAGPRTVHAGR